ncbi:O-antigen translocase [Pseudomonas sp. 7P_10.2_Bac1]|uniref:O-antigen translocase n=1 Tax=Pseudomonas sp. 7P_10.2_Bac1 TaxID=2971614 RepID=UPI0021C8741F|nr:O-antigen translocase [Pseudomonas sp. 7P_10.2_Bac1]MCU1728755.1 O-antigen translocase [Pseudomonas sp. 7P_10.2_Bac1]
MMTLLRTSVLNGVAVIVKMLTLLGINKILAIYVGPSGYAALGQFQNALQMISTFTSGAINTGVTKYTAEYSDDVAKQQAVWRTAGTLATIISLIMAILVAVFSGYLAELFFKDKGLSGVFWWLSGGLILLALNSLILAILNGKKDILRYVAANIVGSIFALCITGFLAVKYGLYGALVALALYQSISFFVTIYICKRASWFKLHYLFGAIDKSVAKNLFKYVAMALTSAACVPLSQILIRNHLATLFGWDAAGYWEAITRFSSAYLLLVTSTLSVYYLPKLSELKSVIALKAEITQGYKYVLPCVALMAGIVYVLRDFIINLLFTSDFGPMRELFAWQMIGDTLKIGSWILAYVMLSKAMFKMFMITEVLFAISYVLMVVVFTHYFGFVGVTVAYAINYAIYWVVIALLMSRKFKAAVLSNKDGVLC